MKTVPEEMRRQNSKLARLEEVLARKALIGGPTRVDKDKNRNINKNKNKNKNKKTGNERNNMG